MNSIFGILAFYSLVVLPFKAFADNSDNVDAILAQIAGAQEEDIFKASKMRRHDTVMLLANIGITNTNFSGRSDNGQKWFDDAHGNTSPYSVAIVVFPKIKEDRRLRFGYSLDVGTTEKKESFIIGSTASSFHYGIIGGSAMYYLTNDKQWYLRGALGLSSLGFDYTEELFGDKKVESKESYSGFGAAIEIGKAIQLTYFAPFAVSFTVRDISSGTFGADDLNAIVLSANVGMLY